MWLHPIESSIRLAHLGHCFHPSVLASSNTTASFPVCRDWFSRQVLLGCACVAQTAHSSVPQSQARSVILPTPSRLTKVLQDGQYILRSASNSMMRLSKVSNSSRRKRAVAMDVSIGISQHRMGRSDESRNTARNKFLRQSRKIDGHKRTQHLGHSLRSIHCIAALVEGPSAL
jgi:hypothetical protein